MAGKIVIKYNRLPQIAKRLPKVVEAIVRKTAYKVQAYAKAIVPVDTGKLKNSITCEFPEEFKAIVAPHTEYAGIVERGGRNQRARPYMGPAAEKARPEFIEACRGLEEQLI